MSDEIDHDQLNGLANTFGDAISDALHDAVTASQQLLPDVSDKAVIFAAINGGVTGVMQFMSDMANAGRLEDPDGKVELMFHLAASVWTQIRGGPADPKGTTQ